jgi:hypothetical protein
MKNRPITVVMCIVLEQQRVSHKYTPSQNGKKIVNTYSKSDKHIGTHSLPKVTPYPPIFSQENKMLVIFSSSWSKGP